MTGTVDIQELRRLAEAARNVAPDVAYVRNQETGDLFEVRVSNFPPADIEVRKMAYAEDVIAEAAYSFSRSPSTILALIEIAEAADGLVDFEAMPLGHKRSDAMASGFDRLRTALEGVKK